MNTAEEIFAKVFQSPRTGLWLTVLLLLVCADSTWARLPLEKLERTSVAGSDYVRISEWTSGAGFTASWSKAAGIITIKSGTARIELAVDSRRAEISGTAVWLSMPVINRGGALLISLVDLRTTIEPILFPRKMEGHLQTICLDPGHGGKDTGKIDGHNYEKIYALMLAHEVEELLTKAGFKVVLTRNNDTFVELSERQQIARRQKADLFVSLHYNAAERNIRGVEVYCLSPMGMNSSNDGGGKAPYLRESGNATDELNVLLAYALQRNITLGTTMQDHGMKRARFEVLREATEPSILIEGGFMSNSADARNIYDNNYRKRMAQAIVDGILIYKKAVERS